MNHVADQSDNDEPSSDAISDEELAALALSADRDLPLNPDATPWSATAGYSPMGLPEWYMPRAIAIGRGRGTRFVVVSIIVGFLVINAFGLCITSGFLSFA